MFSHRNFQSRARRVGIVLVVDDDADNVELLRALLEAEGHCVRAFTSSRQALEFARRHPVDLALLDVAMPGLDGPGLARGLRESPGLRDLAIVFHTGEREGTVRASFAGYDLFLPKPAPWQGIVEALAALMTRRGFPDVGDADGAEFMYVSRWVEDAPASSVAEITRQSRSHNATHGITGLLVFDGQAFLQLIEGPAEPIATLRDRLLDDPRHERIEALWFGRTDGTRRFPGWQLGYHLFHGGGSGVERMKGLRGADALAAFDALLPEVDCRAGAAVPG